MTIILNKPKSNKKKNVKIGRRKIWYLRVKSFDLKIYAFVGRMFL